jgi:hypothetical protein
MAAGLGVPGASIKVAVMVPAGSATRTRGSSEGIESRASAQLTKPLMVEFPLREALCVSSCRSVTDGGGMH